MYSPVSSAMARTIFVAGPANSDAHPLPAGLGGQGAGIAGLLVARLLPRELHVSAEQNQADFEVRLAAVESEQPGTEADAERVDLDVEEASDQIVTQLVEQDHHSDQNQEPPEIL